MVEVSFLTEDDADVMRYIGPEPESGSVLLRCCGCGTWLKPDRSQMQTFCNQQCWTCEQEDCLQWRRELFENDENCRKLLEPPIIRHIRHRNATDTSQKLKLSIMKVISHYCQLPTGFIKEERVCTHQNEDQMSSLYKRRVDSSYVTPPPDRTKLRSGLELKMFADDETTNCCTKNMSARMYIFGSSWRQCLIPMKHSDESEDYNNILETVMKHWCNYKPGNVFRSIGYELSCDGKQKADDDYEFMRKEIPCRDYNKQLISRAMKNDDARTITINDDIWERSRKRKKDSDRQKSQIMTIVFREVLNYLVRELPYTWKELVTLNNATNSHLCNEDDVTRILTSRFCNESLLELKGHDGEVWYASCNMEDTTIVTASADRTARVWDATTGKQRCSIEDIQRFASVCHDGGFLITSSKDGKIACIRSMKTGECLRKLQMHDDCIRSASFSHDRKFVVTASEDGTVIVWNINKGTIVHVLGTPWLQAPPSSALFSANGSQIVTTSVNGNIVYVWNATTGECIHRLKGHSDRVNSASYSPDSTMIVTASEDKTARVWRADTGESVHTLQGYGCPLIAASYSPDGLHILLASNDFIDVWNGTHGMVLMHRYAGFAEKILNACYNSGGTRIVAVTSEGTAHVLSAPLLRLK